jgi:hypothetical protein
VKRPGPVIAQLRVRRTLIRLNGTMNCVRSSTDGVELQHVDQPKGVLKVPSWSRSSVASGQRLCSDRQ